jgi:hypothetical protein
MPAGITRFNYWNYEFCRPTGRAADSLVPPWTPLRSVVGPKIDWPELPPISVEGQLYLLDRFARHLQLGPCDEEGCALRGSMPSRWPELALEDFVTFERNWRSVTGTSRIFRRLPADVQQRIREIDARRHGRIGRRSWTTLLNKIARDQQDFAAMFPVGPKAILNNDDDDRTDTEAADEDDNNAPEDRLGSTRKVWTVYARGALEALGHNPDGETSKLQGGRQRAKLDLAGLKVSERQRVLHWFAHAFRNLVRYRDRHPPLPFDDSCSSRCKRELKQF